MTSVTRSRGGRGGTGPRAVGWALIAATAAAGTAQVGSSRPASERGDRSSPVSVGGGIATIVLPDGWRFLEQDAAREYVASHWGGVTSPNMLGLLVPDAGWGSLAVSYEPIGRVSDADAATLDADAMLQEMQEDARAGNPARRRRGAEGVELLGWAEPPRWDAAARRLTWARWIRGETRATPTLNYDARILGASGVLLVRGVADVGDPRIVCEAARRVLERTELGPGWRYEDSDPDRPAGGRGVRALITGEPRVAVGLLKVLAKPLIAVAVVLVALWIRRRTRAAAAPPPG